MFFISSIIIKIRICNAQIEIEMFNCAFNSTVENFVSQFQLVYKKINVVVVVVVVVV